MYIYSVATVYFINDLLAIEIGIYTYSYVIHKSIYMHVPIAKNTSYIL